ncbi:hypothetical protein ACLOJK_008958 [Asimina triloba]
MRSSAIAQGNGNRFSITPLCNRGEKLPTNTLLQRIIYRRATAEYEDLRPVRGQYGKITSGPRTESDQNVISVSAPNATPYKYAGKAEEDVLFFPISALMAIDDEGFSDENPKVCTVLGGCSFIGKSLVSMLLKSERWIVRITDRSASLVLDRREENSILSDAISTCRASYFQVDVREKSQVREAIKGSVVVFHMDTLDSSVNDFYRHYMLIVQGEVNPSYDSEVAVLEPTSADVIFDGVHSIVNGDESLPYPWKAEALVLFANGTDGLLTCALRPSNVFGPGERHFIPFLIGEAKSFRAKAPFMGAGWGATTRGQNREDCDGPKRTISQHVATGFYNWYQRGTPPAPFMGAGWGATTRGQNREDCDDPKQTISQHVATGFYNWYQRGTPPVGVVRERTRRKLVDLKGLGELPAGGAGMNRPTSKRGERNGGNLCDFTYVDNVAHAHICAEETLHPGVTSVAGKAFFITNLEPLKIIDYVSLILDGLGFPSKHNFLSTKTVITSADYLLCHEGVALTIDSYSDLAADSPYMKYRDHYHPSKAEKLLGCGRGGFNGSKLIALYTLGRTHTRDPYVSVPDIAMTQTIKLQCDSREPLHRQHIGVLNAFQCTEISLVGSDMGLALGETAYVHVADVNRN